VKHGEDQQHTGRILLFTGEGKGKTTAAMGQVLRLAGHGRKVLVIQFAKEPGTSGEQRSLEKLSEWVTVRALGKGWLDLAARPPRDEDLKQVRAAWGEACDLIRAGDYDAVVLDEIVLMVSAGFLPADDVLRLLDSLPAEMTVVMTGRGEVEELARRADTVTVMQKVKHPFDEGGRAARGIEY